MTITQTIRTRISTRAFLNKPVTRETINELLDITRWSPSGGNVQPWRVDVVTGRARERVINTVKKAMAGNMFSNEAELQVYPSKLWEPHRTYRYGVGEAMYEKLGIPREDKAARFAHLARNFEFFGAPVGMFFSLDRRFDKGQWAHLGMFMQTLCLAAEEMGLGTCMQEAWTPQAKTVSKVLELPESQQLYCGLALGYADTNAPVNSLRSDRAKPEEFTHYHEK